MSEGGNQDSYFYKIISVRLGSETVVLIQRKTKSIQHQPHLQTNLNPGLTPLISFVASQQTTKTYSSYSPIVYARVENIFVAQLVWILRRIRRGGMGKEDRSKTWGGDWKLSTK